MTRLPREGGALVAAIIACWFVAGAPPASADSGADFGARDTIECPSAEEAQPRSLTAALAARLLQCSMEFMGDTANFYEINQVKLGRLRPAQPQDYYHDIDMTQPVLPIRASMVLYRCHNRRTYPAVGQDNCKVFDVADAVGYCYVTTFGDMRCLAKGTNNMRNGDFPPPR
jgi:hypothetical protein